MPSSCLREKALAITHWEDRPMPSLSLMGRFEAGHEGHSFIVRKLLEYGFRVDHIESPLEIKDDDGHVILTGHPDLRMSFGEYTYVVEIKTVTPFAWAKINSLADFAKLEWFDRYPWQLQIYLHRAAAMWGADKVRGLFLLSNLLGEWKPFEVTYSEEMASQALTNAATVTKHVREGTLPEYTQDLTLCAGCWAREAGICVPPALEPAGPGLHVWTDPEIPIKIARVLETADVAKEHGDLKDELRDLVKQTGAEHIIAGDYEGTAKYGASTSYDIPKETKEQFKITDPRGRCTVKWQKLGGLSDVRED